MAGLAVVLLLAAFCLPMIFAFGKGENAGGMFWGALGVSFLVPFLVYMFLMAYKMFGKKETCKGRKIENVIFDVGNVLMDFGWEAYLESFGFSPEKYEKIADATFRSNVWNERDRGVLTEEEYVKQCIELAPEYAKDIREVMRRTPECITIMDYAETWVKYLKNQGINIYILSNYGNYMLKKNRSQMTFLKYADGAVFSCEVKQLKPEPEIYETLLNRYAINPSKSVFLDDKKENCEGAEKLGMHSILFKDFKQAVSELEKLGVQ